MKSNKLNGRIMYLVSSLSTALSFYDIKLKYRRRKQTTFSAWLTQSYYQYRLTYNLTWKLLDEYYSIKCKEHKAREVFDQFPAIPQGIPLLPYKEYIK